MILDIILNGQYYNHWPFVAITCNGQRLFSGEIQETQHLTFDVECRDCNQLVIEHYGKLFGENNVWDKSIDGPGSCNVQIVDLIFDQVSAGPSVINNLEFVTNWTAEQLTESPEFIQAYSRFLCQGQMDFNGTVSLEFPKSIYNWLIDKKYKVPIVNTAYFSDYSSRWHYARDVELLEEIKTLVKYDKNRSNKRS